MRVLAYAHIDSRMSALVNTLRVALSSLVFFLVTFALLFLGFVFFSQLYNGRLLIDGYLTYFDAMNSCFNLLFDPFNSDLFPASTSWPFWIWYYSYMIVMVIMELNLVIAILVAAFEAARVHATLGSHRTIGEALSQWRALSHATRRLPDGRASMARVYAYTSQTTEEAVQRAARCVFSDLCACACARVCVRTCARVCGISRIGLL